MQTALKISDESTAVFSIPTGRRNEDGDRRAAERTITLYRIARINSGTDSGLGRVLNISDSGLMLLTALSLKVGDEIAVTFSDTVKLPGKVIWERNGKLGLALLETIDAAATLQELADERRRGLSRAPRVETDLRAVATSLGGLQSVRVLNMSQHGMRITHNGTLQEGAPVRLHLENGSEGRGVVRWSAEGVAGLQLLEPLPYQKISGHTV